ncbi:hypothetical protein BC629DRAFT_1725846 [Irpex lacteus]|nr:hypothetical protein BC629DRAFT_1725846 [Irpex lacteus]
MSQAKLTLRPPPNVDFVQGYPGIPPGAPDRPQAAVKGAIEVRVGPTGVKAKWVRIELRKIETLPGGGLANTFFDFVGQSPLNLWQSQGEYSSLTTQDFPFYIRIPESIPPSIALEKGGAYAAIISATERLLIYPNTAGIKYELIATLCIKGKKGFFRRDKHVVLSTSAPIIIDKHELHSTWPVYAQPETRNLSQEGVTLVVDRTHTCYGPGDRVSVNATVRSEVPQTVILRGFEFALRETMVFRAGGQASGKKSAPQVKMSIIGEQKVPVNATLYGGALHKAELAVSIPERHTTTTLNAARHIDITYVLTVKALLSSGQPVMIDLPVIISNWPKSVSVAAVRRIGLASNVASHTPGGQQPAPQIGQHIVPPSTIGSSVSSPPPTTIPTSAPLQRPPTANTAHSRTESVTDGPSDIVRPAATSYNTAPALGGLSRVDEFGRPRAGSIDPEPQVQTIGGPARPFVESDGVRLRARSNTANTANRLTVTNFADDMPEEVRQQQQQQLAARSHARQASLTARAGPVTRAATSGWLTAEEEKKRLYESAQAKVEAAHQGNIPRASSPVYSKLARTAWPTAEEEKASCSPRPRMPFVDARKHGAGTGSPPPESTHSRNGSLNAQPGMSAGAALYSQAMSLSRETHRQLVGRIITSSLAKRTNASYIFQLCAVAAPASAPAPTPSPPNSAPVSYNALYPTATTPAPITTPPPPGPGELPPAFSPGPNGQPQYLSEKEKLRRAYEERDRAALAAQSPSPPTPTPNGPPAINGPPIGSAPPDYMPSPVPYSPPPPQQPNGIGSALSEKEILRRRFEQQDAAALANNRTAPPPTPPPRSVDGHVSAYAAWIRAWLSSVDCGRGEGPPPSNVRSGGTGCLCRLCPPASPPPPGYVNGINGVNGVNGINGANVARNGSINSVSLDYSRIPPPPPLAPKPPKEYIHETQEEDQKIAAQIQAIDKETDSGSPDPTVKAGLSVEQSLPYSSYTTTLPLLLHLRRLLYLRRVRLCLPSSVWMTPKV